MALPATLLESLPTSVSLASALGQSVPSLSEHVRSLGSSLDEALPDGGLLKGAVVEVAVEGGAALGTSVALAACRAAQEEGRQRGGATPWCAFIDPAQSLYAPAVSQAGVELERLLVVRPTLRALSRVATRLVEAQAFSVVVIDTVGSPGSPLEVPIGSWTRVVRRLAIGVENTEASVVLLTDLEARRSLPLPVATRIELERSGVEQLSVRVAKDKRGRVSQSRKVHWQPELIASVAKARSLGRPQHERIAC